MSKIFCSFQFLLIIYVFGIVNCNKDPKNVFGNPLELCSTQPLTGYYYILCELFPKKLEHLPIKHYFVTFVNQYSFLKILHIILIIIDGIEMDIAKPTNQTTGLTQFAQK